jgi:intron-binding protein aquarius
MINEKFRERSAVFDFLATDAARASAFVERVCDAAFVERQKTPGRLMVVRFLVGAFQNLSTEFVRVPLLKLVHLPLWDSVSPTLLQIEVRDLWFLLFHANSPQLSGAPKPIVKQWRVYNSQKAKGKTFDRESRFLPFLFDNLLFPNLSSSGKGNEVLGQRVLELAIDLLAQLPTRRYFKMFCVDRLLLPRLTLASAEMSLTTKKLVQMLRYYLEFEVDEFSGQALSFDEVTRAHAARLARLQEVAFGLSESGNQSAGLREFAVSHIAGISSRPSLKRILASLDDGALRALASAAGVAERVTERPLLTETLLLACQVKRRKRLSAMYLTYILYRLALRSSTRSTACRCIPPRRYCGTRRSFRATRTRATRRSRCPSSTCSFCRTTTICCATTRSFASRPPTICAATSRTSSRA